MALVLRASLLAAAVLCVAAQPGVTMFNLNQWFVYRDAEYALTQVNKNENCVNAISHRERGNGRQ